MPNGNDQVLLRHALQTGQFVVKDNYVSLSDTVSKPVLNTYGRIFGNKPGLPLSQNPQAAMNREQHAFLKMMKQSKAEDLIRSKYEQLGTFYSPLGLSASPSLEVVEENGVYKASFRGGEIRVKDPLAHADIQAEQRLKVEIWFNGLINRQRQEKTDEIYGSVSVVMPSNGSSKIIYFPEGIEYLEFGEGMRVSSMSVKLYDGPPADVYILASLVEKDSGDTEKYRQAIAGAIANGVRSFAGSQGVSAETFAADNGLINDLSLGVVNLVYNALGAADDPYQPQVLAFDWENLVTAPAPQKTNGGGDDGRELTYTHEIIVKGVDDGGDQGTYGFYFQVKVIRETRLI